MKTELEEMLEDILTSIKDEKRITKEKISNGINEPCKIVITKTADGRACLEMDGTKIALLVALAGLERNMLAELDCTEEEYEQIKMSVGTKAVSSNG